MLIKLIILCESSWRDYRLIIINFSLSLMCGCDRESELNSRKKHDQMKLKKYDCYRSDCERFFLLFIRKKIIIKT